MRVKPGDVIQSLTCLSGDMLSKSTEVRLDLTYDQQEECHRAFWMVVSILGSRKVQEISPLGGMASAFALVLPCEKYDGVTIGIQTQAIASTIIPLTHCVRRAMVVHKCEGGDGANMDCISSSEQESCCPRIEEGGQYEVFGHAEGYPLRSA